MMKKAVIAVIIALTFLAFGEALDDGAQSAPLASDFEYDLLSGIQPNQPHGSPVNIRMTCRWHGGACTPGTLPGGAELPDGSGLDMVPYIPSHPWTVYVAFRHVPGRGSKPLEVRFIPAQGDLCKTVMVEVMDGLDTPAVIRYKHVINDGLSPGPITLNAQTNPSDRVEIGRFILPRMDNPRCTNLGAHLHQQVNDDAGGLVGQFYRNRDANTMLGIGQAVVHDYIDENGMPAKIVDPYSVQGCFSSSMWLWKIASQTPTTTATKTPSTTCPSSLKVSVSTTVRPGQPTLTVGGKVLVDPVGGPYVANEQVTLTASANDGYIFGRWDPNSGCSDLESSTCVITLPGETEKTVTATFAPAIALRTGTQIVGGRMPGGGGTITPERGDHVYPLGKKVKVSVSIAPGYTFSHWVVDGGLGRCSPPGSEPPGLTRTCTVTMTADTKVTAHFLGPKGLTIPSSNAGSITCTVGGTSTNCEGATTNYTHGTTVWLSATPDNADTHEFSHWTVSTSGGVSGSADTRHTKNPLDVTLDADTTVTATFTAKATPTPTPTPTSTPTPTYKLTATAGSGGSIQCRTGSTSGPIVGCTDTLLDEDTVVKIIPTVSSTHTFGSWTGCDSTSTANVCTVTMTAAKTVTASFTAKPTPDPDPDPDPPPTGGTPRVWSETVTRWGWTANCRRGGGSGSDNGTKSASAEVAAAAARVWIHRNCPRAGGTYEIIDTRTYYWSVTCRIGTGSQRGSGYTSWSAAEAAGRAWRSANCPKGGGTSSTSSTTRWYADVICVHGNDFPVGPFGTEAEARTAGEFAARTLCPQASISGDAPTPTAQASDDDVGGEEGHSAYSVRPVTTYSWTARCTNGGGRGSRSGYTTQAAAASAGQAWVDANCVGGGRLTTGSNTTHGWEGSCTSGGGSSSGSGHIVRSAAAAEAGAWVIANCAGGGTFSTPSTPVTLWNWSASCNSGSGSHNGSGLGSQSAATTAAQAWITANCGG